MVRPGSLAAGKAAGLGKEPDKIPLAGRIKCTQCKDHANHMGTDIDLLTEQGGDNPVSVQVRGGGAGLSGPSASNCGAPSVIDQAEGSDITTGIVDNENIDPFKRRDSIIRTPPGMKAVREKLANRKNSFSSVLSTEQSDEDTDGGTRVGYSVAQHNKRKRREDTVVDDDRNILLDSFAEALESTLAQIDLLSKVLANTYKPKKEFKEISKKC